MGRVSGNGGNGSYKDPDFPRISLEEAARKLGGKVERDKDGRDVIRCPGPDHSAGDRSLSVWIDDDEPGGLGVFSFSDKDAHDIPRLKDYARSKLGFPEFKPNGHAKARNGKAYEIIAKYLYQDEDGQPVLLVNRTKTKEFPQQHPVASGWAWGGIDDKAKVPFRLPELIEAIGAERDIYITEGEKAALALIERGYTATCSPGGACKWPPHFVKWFKGAKVIVLPDNDLVGKQHADKVVANIGEVVASIKVIHLPVIPGGDVYDFLAGGGDAAKIATMREGPPARGHLATELWDMNFPAINFAVPVYIAEGLTLFAGAPKRGKSWLALDVCVAVASGGYVLGDQHCIQGDVLYAALEDSPRRMKARLRTVCSLKGRAPERLTVWFGRDLTRLGAGCEEAIREWVDSVPNPRLIVIDTLNYIRPERTRDEDPYSYDYRSAMALQRIASEFALAIVIIHHTRKSAADDYLESISGTNGLTGGSDAVMVLERQGDGSTVLKGRGRDVEEFDVAMKFDMETCRWSVLGSADESRLSETRSKILKILRDAPYLMSVSEIASQTGLQRNTVDQRLMGMLKAGEVIRIGRGKYGLPDAVHEDGNVIQFPGDKSERNEPDEDEE